MNILVLNGSPHVKGTTAVLRKHFEEGLRVGKHRITTIHIAKEKIHPCTGCDYCRTSDDGCVYKDSMETIYPELLAADLVVFVTPLYYFGMSAQIKALIDRFYAINGKLKGAMKKAVLIAACGDTDSWALDALNEHYYAICRYLKWEDIGKVNAVGAYTPDDLEESNYTKEAYELGASIK